MNPAEVVAFSLSLRAQVLSAFLISGMHYVGCFNRLVAFQSEWCQLSLLSFEGVTEMFLP
jgi:hypothetical protein